MAAQALNISSIGTTSAPSESSAIPVAGLAPAPAVASQDHDHRRALKRWFIGPMPEKTAGTQVLVRKKSWIKRHGTLPRPLRQRSGTIDNCDEDSASCSSDEAAGYGGLRREYIYRYFKRSGGKDEDWNPETERGIRKEIKRKWRESKWYHVWRGDAKKNAAASADRKWVGNSFIVGEVLGVGA